MTDRPFILVKASSMPMIESLEESIKDAGYRIKEIYNISNGWEVIKQFYLNNKSLIEFNLEVEIHAWLEKFLFGEAAYILFIDTDVTKTLTEKCHDALQIKRNFRNKFTLSRDGTFMIAMDILKTPFKPLNKWKKGKLKLGRKVFDNDIAQRGIFRGYYFKYIHTPDNLEEYYRHMQILNKAGVINDKNRIYPKEWKMIKCAIKGDHKSLHNLVNGKDETFER